MYLGILDEPEDEIELEDFSSDSESSNEESTIGEMEYANNDKDEKEEVDVVENVEEEEEGEIAERTFDMKLNLERIGCGRFYPDLVAEGFVDEVIGAHFFPVRVYTLLDSSDFISSLTIGVVFESH